MERFSDHLSDLTGSDHNHGNQSPLPGYGDQNDTSGVIFEEEDNLEIPKEPLSSLNRPHLTPLAHGSEEKTPTELGVGNLPHFIQDFENSKTLSGNTVISKSSKSSESKHVTHSESSTPTIPCSPDKKPLDSSPETEMAKEAKSDEHPAKRSDLKFEIPSSNVSKTPAIIESGPQTLPALLPSAVKVQTKLPKQGPKSMFYEEEEILSDELFASGLENPTSPAEQLNSPDSYVPEVNIVDHSPGGSTSSEISFSKLKKGPFQPFQLAQEAPYTGEPSILTEDRARVMQIPETRKNSDGLDQEFVVSPPRRPSNLSKLDIQKSPKQMRKNRLSQPDFPVTTPITPYKFSTPQNDRSSPIFGIKRNDTSGLGSSRNTVGSENNLKFPQRYRIDSSYQSGNGMSASPRSWSQIDENEKEIRKC